MISLLDLNKVIIEKLRENLINTPFEKIPILPLDEGDIVRPSMKVNMEASRLESVNANWYGRTISTSIYFFASNTKRYRLENMKIQEILESVFIDGFRVSDDFYVYIDDVEIEVVDTILIISFSFEMKYAKEKLVAGEGGFMENLDFELI